MKTRREFSNYIKTNFTAIVEWIADLFKSVVTALNNLAEAVNKLVLQARNIAEVQEQ
jgi:hypothetical protein